MREAPKCRWPWPPEVFHGAIERLLPGARLGRSADAEPIGVIAPLVHGHRLGHWRDVVGRRRDHAEVVDRFLQGIDRHLGGRSAVAAFFFGATPAMLLDHHRRGDRVAMFVRADRDALERERDALAFLMVADS